MSHVFHVMILSAIAIMVVYDPCRYTILSKYAFHQQHWEIRLEFTYCGDVYDAPYPENGVIVRFRGLQGQVLGFLSYVSKYSFQKFHYIQLDQSWGSELQEADMASIVIHLEKMFVAWYGQSKFNWFAWQNSATSEQVSRIPTV